MPRAADSPADSRTEDGGTSAAHGDAVDVGALYAAHAEHVWRCLHRLGVRDADLPDLLHEVFLVVHRRAADYDPLRPVGAWLWGICVGLAQNYRRRAFRRVERLVDAPEGATERDAEGALDASRRVARGRAALDALDPERRAVFVMFEMEAMSGREIAELLAVPIGTVHSRLHSARAAIAAALAAEEAP